ncbi:MAG: N-acetyltransferase [Pseudomonadota bacterium]|jgi:putative acetyltransferase
MMIVRPETSIDIAKIYRLVEAAFADEPHAEGDEQDFVERLRASRDYVAELARVGVRGESIIAHLMMTRLAVQPPATRSGLLLLAAVSVDRDWRKRGLGTRMIEDAFDRARALGFRSVLVVGDPEFYRRFGFRPSTEFGLANLNGIEDRYVQALELTPGALAGPPAKVALPI